MTRPEIATKVSVRSVTKRFGDFVANQSIDVDIHRGEFLTLLGPSGCGKTTLMRIIAGLETCDEGSVIIDGRDVTHVPPRHRGIGMVFQNYALFPHMNVRENVAYGLKARGHPRAHVAQEVERVLSIVRLPDIADRMPRALSGGQQQRVALARALATKPSLLMLDEPLAALDLKLRQQLQHELRRIHREMDVTFLFVTHDQEEALFLSDRIAVMRAGQIEQIAAPDVIYAKPANAYIADFIGEVSLLACTRRDIDPRSVSLDEWPNAAPLTMETSVPFPTGLLAVRPEHVVIEPAGSGALDVSVDDVINEGSTTLVLLRSPQATTLKARLIGRPPFPLHVGAPIAARIVGAPTCLPV